MIYECHISYAIVEEHLEEFDDITVNFLHPTASVNTSTYHHPSEKDSCAVPILMSDWFSAVDSIAGCNLALYYKLTKNMINW